MKATILFVVHFALPFLMLAQFEIPQPEKGFMKTHFVNKSKGLVQVLDSSYMYQYNAGVWEKDQKKCIHSRHWGTLGLPNEWYHYDYNSATDSWDLAYYEHYTYLSDTAEIVDEKLIKPYNRNTLSWENDSQSYYNYKGYYSSQLADLLEQQITMNYNQASCNYVSGMRYDISFKNDTLYDIALVKGYDNVTGSWFNYYQMKFTYDANNFMQRQQIMLWSSTDNVYQNYYQGLYSYQNGLLMQQVTQIFTGSDFENSQKFMYTYNSERLKTGEYDQQWDDINNEWVNNSQTLYAYTGGYLTEQTGQSWNTVTDSWDNITRYIMTYNTNGDMLTKRTENWDGSSWKYTSRETWTYNAQYQITSDLIEDWDIPTTSWQGNNKTTYTYDGNNNLTLRLTQAYDGGTFSWVNWAKTEYEYDANNNNTLVTDYEWDDVSTTWLGTVRTENFYSAFDATSLSELSNSEMLIYPNPTNGTIYFNVDFATFETISFSDVTGRVVFESQLNLMENSVNLANYGKGLYNITLVKQDGERVSSQVAVY